MTYGDLPLPTFHIQLPEAALRLLHGSCRLLHGNGHDAFIAADDLLSDTAICQEIGVEGESPGIFVSPVPVFGLEVQERRQKFLAGRLGPYEIDFEAWHSNLQGLVDFIAILVEELKLRRCVVLSRATCTTG